MGPGTPHTDTNPMRSAARLSLIATTALFACTPSPVDVNQGVVPFTPPAQFLTWWDEVQDCSHETGDFTLIDWFLANGFAAGAEVVGQWSPPHSITFRHGFERMENVVKHEMLHDLLRGDKFHDEWAWIQCRLPIG